MTHSPSKKEIATKLEATPVGVRLIYRLSPTFGGQFAVLERNADTGQEGEKAFFLRVGKSKAEACDSKPFFAHNKAKKLAAWVADRSPIEASEE